MTDLIELDDQLSGLRIEMQSLGMPQALVQRVDALHSILPNIERARERRREGIK